MNYTAHITVSADKKEQEQLIALFAAEDKELGNKRARYTIASQDSKVAFNIEAQDAVALRATITSITKTLGVFEGTKNMIEGQK